MTVSDITTTVQGHPQEVTLGPADGMPRDFAVNLDRLTV